jgi:hypothetical protein
MKSRQIGDSLFTTSWYGKTPVNMLHIFATVKESVLRNTKEPVTNKYKKAGIERPSVIRAYNEGMGGTDSFDQRLAHYRPAVKTKRCPHRIIFHLFQCSLINAHIIYKEVNGLEKRDNLHALFSFVDGIIDEIAMQRTDDAVSSG